MRKLMSVLLLVLLLCLPMQALADEDGENLIFNGGLECESVAEPPTGWSFTAHDDSLSEWFTGETEDGTPFVSISSYGGNDARFVQLVTVEPDALYTVSAEINTVDVYGGTGASISIDNYDIDGTYCYSANQKGTEDWHRVEMTVRTTEKQTVLRVALRLGGYGTTAMGDAAFRNVSMMRVSGAGDGVIDLATSNGEISGHSVEAEPEAESRDSGRAFVYIIGSAVLALIVFVLVYCRVFRFGEAGAERFFELDVHFALQAVLVFGAIVRVLLSLVFYGHSTDIACFMAWGNALLNNGFAGFYTSGMFADYPPLYMAVCGGLSWVCRVFGIGYGTNGMALLFKLPATIADILSAYLVYRIARENRLSEKFSFALAALLLFDPVLAFVSGAWGQIDTLLTLLLVLSCRLLQREKRISAGAVYGIAILLKPQALMLGPILAAAYLLTIVGDGWKRRLRDTVLAVLAALVTIAVLALPFKGTQELGWLIEKYFSTASSYPYASIEAFNFAALIGANWKRIEDTVLLGIPYQVFGTVMIALSVAYAVLLYWKGHRKSRGALYLAGGVMLLSIFTFGHFMHERYMLPALLLLLIAYVYERDNRLLIGFGALSVSSFLNATAAMYIVDAVTARGAVYDGIVLAGSLLTVAATVFLLWAAFDIAVCGHTSAPKKLPKTLQPGKTPSAGAYTAILPDRKTDTKLHLTKKERLTVCALTAVYAVIALTNLGTLKAPESFFEGMIPGEGVTVRFDEPTHIRSYWVNGNIGNDGTVLVRADDGTESTFDQKYDDMFRWKPNDVDFVTGRVTVTLRSGAVKLNEMAFIDEDGRPVPVTIEAVMGSGEGAKLFDEQDTVPKLPSYFNGMYFDELYHARTAYEHLHNLAPYENSHPPLGKIFIMLGIAVFGMNPFGWRVVGALTGIAMLPLFYCLARRLMRSGRYALIAMLLLMADFMHFTQTRIATIDVYSVFFILLMYDFMYRYMTMNFFVDGVRATLRPLALAGLFFGIGASSKWTSIYAGAGLAVLLLISLIERYREYRAAQEYGTKAERARTADYWKNVGKTLLWCVVFYVVVPVTVYWLSYLPYYIYEAGQNAAYGVGDTFGTMWRYQTFMYGYHSNLNATHPYQSMWYTWPITLKPMWYYFNSYADGTFVSTMSASGNPAVWWVSAVGAVALVILVVKKRVKKTEAIAVLFVGILANYLPWIAVTRCTFIYHFFATLPFVILSAVYALKTAEERNPSLNGVPWVWVGAAILMFVLLYPGISGYPVSPRWAGLLKKLPGGKLMYGA